jgi:branched-chain amino acid transport system permease protein
MLIQHLSGGLALGSIYALVALGFILIYKATEVLNFSQGEIMMLGAFVAYSCMVFLNLAFWVSVLLTFVVMGVFGYLTERVLLRPLMGEPLFSLVMVTIGLSAVIRSGCGMIWTHDTLKFPEYLGDAPIRVGGIIVSQSHFWVFMVSLALVLVLSLFFKFTGMGIAMRATGLNQLATLLVGINIKNIFSLTWAMSAILAAIAGVLMAPILFLSTNMGFIGFKAFPAAILGGFGSVPGAIIGGYVIGISENLAGAYLAPGLKDVFAYVILILVLLVKPEGIFGVPELRRV